MNPWKGNVENPENMPSCSISCLLFAEPYHPFKESISTVCVRETSSKMFFTSALDIINHVDFTFFIMNSDEYTPED